MKVEKFKETDTSLVIISIMLYSCYIISEYMYNGKMYLHNVHIVISPVK